MRRLTMLVILGVLVGLIGPPAMARKYEHFNAPATQMSLEGFAVRAFDCEDGDTWQAYVTVILKDDSGQEVFRKRRRAEDNALSRTRVYVPSIGLSGGDFTLIVKCIHRFQNGSRGVWYREAQPFFWRQPGLGEVPG